ncbi:zinc finger CCCH domain-containing protein 32-like isoform X1 [Olea europaea var. sylvestris]|uniref:zinc finger CCCH domain-containing protein 32-like isoform X1 n=1 Tax=Olea europaea var. sylvestris TaxID=158386 RepID=UPI000C1CDBD8|nr:zinc finger CCCH domain-containing protein 32-like isoform X1 [Olea europaea var. sylvestris]XP_022847263.1 zinc finger CCCH domain-containing protein 32-like isoform X1 [Olea europaea var. sylvestris]
MELYGRRSGTESDQQQVEWAPAGQEPGLVESMRGLNLRDGEYPERPGAADCPYYMRTGTCGYGSKCRYNHPHDRGISTGGVMRDYPERVGEPSCQYYLRTGTCKFGPSCKFNHPKNAGGSLTNVPLNIYGYPLRPGQQECSYYLQKGQCKFGRTCKFDHPEPAGLSMPDPARTFYPTGQSLSAPSEQYDSTSTTYRVARPLLHGSYVPGAYAPMLLHPGVVPMTNWNTFSGPVSPAPSPGVQPSVGYRMSQLSSSAPAFTGAYTQLPSSASPLSAGVTLEQQLPERPGEPDCKYYMRTGGCKYGSSCRECRPALFICREVAANSAVLASLIIQWEMENTIPLHRILKCQAEYVAGLKLDLGIIRTRPSGNNSSGSVRLMFSQTVK